MKRVGYWRDWSDPDPWSVVADVLRRFLAGAAGLPSELPDPREFVDTHWRDTRKGREEWDAVVAHLRGGRVQDASFGYSWCRICGRNDNGCKDMTDGTYLWPEGYLHYILEHGVKPPQDLIDHAIRSQDK